MLESSDWKFVTILINVFRALMDKIDSMQEQMSNISTEMEILRRNQKVDYRLRKHCNRNLKCL